MRSRQSGEVQVRLVRIGHVKSDQVTSGRSGKSDWFGLDSLGWSGQNPQVGLGRSDQVRAVRSGQFKTGQVRSVTLVRLA